MKCRWEGGAVVKGAAGRGLAAPMISGKKKHINVLWAYLYLPACLASAQDETKSLSNTINLQNVNLED